MKKVNKKVLKAVERITRNEVIRNIDSWPPFCSGIYHQPKRPGTEPKKSSSPLNMS